MNNDKPKDNRDENLVNLDDQPSDNEIIIDKRGKIVSKGEKVAKIVDEYIPPETDDGVIYKG